MAARVEEDCFVIEWVSDGIVFRDLRNATRLLDTSCSLSVQVFKQRWTQISSLPAVSGGKDVTDVFHRFLMLSHIPKLDTGWKSA